MNDKSNPQEQKVEKMSPETALSRLFDVLIEMDYDLERRKEKEDKDANHRSQPDTNPA